MKNALILGGGSKWGSTFTKTLVNSNYNVDLITSTGIDHPQITNFKIDWNTIDQREIDVITEQLSKKQFDLIFFNQNSGGGPNDVSYQPGDIFPIDHWHKANWINCLINYYIIKKLSYSITKNTKIGWMLTGLIDGKDPQMWKYAGYASVKSTNVHIMRGFSKYHHGVFFAIQPYWFPEKEFQKDATSILRVIENLKKQDNGYIYLKDGSRWNF